MKIMCKIFGHKPVQLSSEFPYYCKRCLEDLRQNEKGKWKIDHEVFFEMVDKQFEEAIAKAGEEYLNKNKTDTM